MVLPVSSRVYVSDGSYGIDLLKKIDDMKLKGNYDIRESGRYTVIFEDENGEWEVEFEIWIDKEYIYEETGRCLIDVSVQARCLSPGYSIEEEVEMEVAIEEYITDDFNL